MFLVANIGFNFFLFALPNRRRRIIFQPQYILCCCLYVPVTSYVHYSVHFELIIQNSFHHIRDTPLHIYAHTHGKIQRTGMETRHEFRMIDNHENWYAIAWQ